MRQPMGLENDLLDLVAELFTLSRFERFFSCLRLAQWLKGSLCMGLSYFIGLCS